MKGVIKISNFYTIPIIKDTIRIKVKKSFSERVNQIYDLLNEYSYYFLANDTKRFRRNWIGVKSVGKKYPDQTMKMNLNSMANYLYLSEDYIIKDKENELIKLERMKKNDDTYEITEHHLELRKDALFYKVPKYKNQTTYIFMVNKDYEDKLLEMAYQDNAKRVLEYHNKYDKIEKIKIEALKLHRYLNQVSKEIKLIKSDIKGSYGELKETKDSSLVSTITELTRKLKDSQNERKFIETQIVNLIDDYKILTNQL